MHQHKLLVVWRTFFFELQQKKQKKQNRKLKGKPSKQPCSEQHGSSEHPLKMKQTFKFKIVTLIVGEKPWRLITELGNITDKNNLSEKCKKKQA